MVFDGELIEAHFMRIGAASGSAAIVDAILSSVDALTAALAPVIGNRGVAALHARSVHIARRTYRWLPEEGESSVQGGKSLRSTLIEHDDAEKAQVAAAILTSFNALLVSLIGSALSTRLLTHVALAAPTERSAQQESP